MKKTLAIVSMLALITPALVRTSSTIDQYAGDRVEVINGVTTTFDADNSEFRIEGAEYATSHNYFYDMYEGGSDTMILNFSAENVLAPTGSVTSNDVQFSVEVNLYLGTNTNTTELASFGRNAVAFLNEDSKYEIASVLVINSSNLVYSYLPDTTYTITVGYSTNNTYSSSDTFTNWITMEFDTPGLDEKVWYDYETEMLVDEIIANHKTSNIGLITTLAIVSTLLVALTIYVGYLYYNSNKKSKVEPKNNKAK